MQKTIKGLQEQSSLGQADRDRQQCTERLAAVGDALYVLGGKWKLRIVIAICDGYCRFNELQRVLEGISSKVLSAELKELELNGLISRTVVEDAIVQVKYEPTPYADSLNDVLRSLATWGVNHRRKLRREG